jgi:hypothetical protein
MCVMRLILTALPRKYTAPLRKGCQSAKKRQQITSYSSEVLIFTTNGIIIFFGINKGFSHTELSELH